jgi:hypothetical protein
MADAPAPFPLPNLGPEQLHPGYTPPVAPSVTQFDATHPYGYEADAPADASVYAAYPAPPAGYDTHVQPVYPQPQQPQPGYNTYPTPVPRPDAKKGHAGIIAGGALALLVGIAGVGGALVALRGGGSSGSNEGTTTVPAAVGAPAPETDGGTSEGTNDITEEARESVQVALVAPGSDAQTIVDTLYSGNLQNVLNTGRLDLLAGFLGEDAETTSDYRERIAEKASLVQAEREYQVLDGTPFGYEITAVVADDSGLNEDGTGELEFELTERWGNVIDQNGDVLPPEDQVMDDNSGQTVSYVTIELGIETVDGQEAVVITASDTELLSDS